MTKYEELKRAIIRRNTTLDALSVNLGMHRSTLYRKTKEGIDGLTIGEAKAITRYLGLSERESRRIFGI